MALAAARTAADAARAQLTAEQIGAQQRLAAFEKLKQDLEVQAHSLKQHPHSFPYKFLGSPRFA